MDVIKEFLFRLSGDMSSTKKNRYFNIFSPFPNTFLIYAFNYSWRKHLLSVAYIQGTGLDTCLIFINIFFPIQVVIVLQTDYFSNIKDC